MTTETTAPMTRRDLETKIIVKAWEDEGFRSRFLTEPKILFEERLGVKLPERLTITAHAEDAGHLHLVIPAKPDIDLDELSDEDLEKVAGGTGLAVVLSLAAFAISLTASAVASMTASAVGTLAATAAVFGKKDGWW